MFAAMRRLAFVLAFTTGAAAFSVAPPCVAVRSRHGVNMMVDPEATRDSAPASGSFSVADAASRIAAAQAAALQAIVAQNNMFPSEKIEVAGAIIEPYIPEEPKKDSSELGLEESRRLAQAADADTKAPKGEVTWCSSLSSGSTFSLTAWNSPQVYVPHLYWYAECTDTSLKLSMDFRPRALAGYETIQEDGTYPEPTTREMFALGSTRMELAELYFTPENLEWHAGLMASAGATAAPTPTPVSGPLLLEVTMPMSEAAVDVACAACEGATERWLSWMAATEKLDQRRIMTVFAHDTKVRAACLAATVQQLAATFGAEGKFLAQADAGPMDITDRTGAQNSAASTNFDEENRDGTMRDMETLVNQGKMTGTEDDFKGGY